MNPQDQDHSPLDTPAGDTPADADAAPKLRRKRSPRVAEAAAQALPVSAAALEAPSADEVFKPKRAPRRKPEVADLPPEVATVQVADLAPVDDLAPVKVPRPRRRALAAPAGADVASPGDPQAETPPTVAVASDPLPARQAPAPDMATQVAAHGPAGLR